MVLTEKGRERTAQAAWTYLKIKAQKLSLNERVDILIVRKLLRHHMARVAEIAVMK